VSNYLLAIKDLYRQRTKLSDAPRVDPLPLDTTFEAAGVTRATKGTIPFIPDEVAVAILGEALRWVEEHGETIIEAETIRLRARAIGLATGISRQASYYVRRALRQAHLTGPLGDKLDGAYAVRHACHLVEACYIVIAGFVGMRVSEILSMKVGAIEYRPIGETGVDQAYVVARLFKTVDHPEGREERWVAPAPVVRAVDLLEQLSAPLRAASGRDEIFLVKNTQYGEIVPVTHMHIGWRINDFARHVGVPEHEGKPWSFSTHQFRKTFARFVARRDRSQLLGLAEHFKHASVAMTARSYVGNDFDLHGLIDHESRAETAAALDQMLTSKRLGGRMGSVSLPAMSGSAAVPVSRSGATISHLSSRRPISGCMPAIMAGACSSRKRRAAAVRPGRAKPGGRQRCACRARIWSLRSSMPATGEIGVRAMLPASPSRSDDSGGADRGDRTVRRRAGKDRRAI
jgi:integrase